jgi:hypothetical protein
MAKTAQFRAKLKQCEPEIRQYIATLESQNLKLQRQVGKLEAINITADNKIKALETRINSRATHMHINRGVYRQPSDGEIESRLAELGYVKQHA